MDNRGFQDGVEFSHLNIQYPAPPLAAGLDNEKDKANRINSLAPIGVALQSARLIDQETSIQGCAVASCPLTKCAQGAAAVKAPDTLEQVCPSSSMAPGGP